MTEATDEALMQQYSRGNIAAFRELYQRHHRGLYRFIAWRSPRHDWVDEIMQDSWAALHVARSHYQPTASFKTYLYQIARNRLIDFLRQKQAISLDEDGDEGGIELPSTEATPDMSLQQQQQINRLNKAIASLPAEQREVLVLQQFNDMSLDEIALITQSNSETVKSRLRYAMQKLKRELQEEQREAL